MKKLKDIKNKKLLLGVLIVLGMVLITGTTLALWISTMTQNDNNIVNSTCFKITFSEEEGINLNNAIPLTDEEGLKGSPYTFTISNTCTGYASYQINVETLENDALTLLPSEYLKVNLKSNNTDLLIAKLNSKMNTEVTIKNGTEAYKLYTGILAPNRSKTFEFRMWMDESIEVDDEGATNSSYKGKVSIVFSYMKEPEYLASFGDMEMFASEDENVCPKSGIVQVSHNDAEIPDAGYSDYGLDYSNVQNNLKQTEYRYCGDKPNNYVSLGERYSETLYYREFNIENDSVEEVQHFTKEQCEAIMQEMNSVDGITILKGCELSDNYKYTFDGIHNYYTYEAKNDELYFFKFNDFGGEEYEFTYETLELCSEEIEYFESEGFSITQGCTKGYEYKEKYDDLESCTAEMDYAREMGDVITKTCSAEPTPYNYKENEYEHYEYIYDNPETCMANMQAVEASGDQITKACYAVEQYDFVYGSAYDLTNSKDECTICQIAHNQGDLISEWQIIGLVNTPKGQRIKLVKKDILPEWMSWDENSSNDWSQATLKEYLNTDYLNSLGDDIKNLIDMAIWNLGAFDLEHDDDWNYSNALVKQTYNYERGINVYGENPKLWQGQVALIYPSDVGYSIGNNRNICLNIFFQDWDKYLDIISNSCDMSNFWLYSELYTLTTLAERELTYEILYNRLFESGVTSSLGKILPTIYLKPEAIILEGKGTVNEPYLVGLNNSF